MKKATLLLLLSYYFGAVALAQGFSFDELARLRSFHYPKFEIYVQNKGYTLNDAENSERCTVFKNEKNVVSYCKVLDDGLSKNNHVSVKFETPDKDEYEKIKKEVASSLEYYNTRSHRSRKEHYLEHIYVSDVLSVHLYDVSYKNNGNPWYVIEINSIYSGY